MLRGSHYDSDLRVLKILLLNLIVSWLVDAAMQPLWDHQKQNTYEV